MRIFDSVLELVGNTPLLEAGNLERGLGLEVRILLKLEYLNPAGSVKDRIAKAMILDARERGLLQEGAVLIEPTSGNTGIGLASMAAALGYRLILTMPETMSVERRNILKAYGAEIVLTDGALGMTGPLIRQRSWLGRFQIVLFPVSLKIRSIRGLILRLQDRRSGGIQTE